MRAVLFSRSLVLLVGFLVGGAVSAQTPPAGNNASGASGSSQVVTTTNPSVASQASQAPMGGREFGEHVSGMAPEHAIDHGRHFGECVSAMAQGAECDHDMMH